MGNKQTKAGAAKPAAAAPQPEKSEVTERPEEKQLPQASSSSPDSSPVVPAYDPEKEKQTETPEVPTEAPQAAVVEKSEVPEESPAGLPDTTPQEPPSHEAEPTIEPLPMEETPKPAETEPLTETPPAVVEAEKTKEEGMAATGMVTEEPTEEEEKDKVETERAEVPPLALGAIQEMASKPTTDPNEEEEEEHDPDLMAPPPFLTDAIGSFKYSEAEEAELHPKKSSDLAESESVTMTMPVISGQLSMDTPSPVTDVPVERDDVSIDEEVAAADGHAPESESRGAVTSSDDLVLSSGTWKPLTATEIPEDVVSLSSSVAARGDEEMMKKIMGTSVQMPDATSNESNRGSVAISELTYDDPGWDSMRRTLGSSWKPYGNVPVDVEVALIAKGDTVVVQFFYEDQPAETSAPEETTENDPEVTGVVQSIFDAVIEKAEVKPATTAPVVAPEVKIEPEVVQVEEAVVESAPSKEVPLLEPVVASPEPEETQSGSVKVKCVSVGLDDVEGEVKVSLTPSAAEAEERSLLHASESQMSASLDLKTPFEAVPPSIDSGEQLQPTAEEVVVEALAAEQQSTEEATTEPTEPLQSSASEGQRKAKKSRSRKKKGKGGEGGRTPSPGLTSSLSDGSAAVDNSGQSSAPPKGNVGGGRSGRGRGRGRGRQGRGGGGGR